MKAISTKYLPATNTRGSRIKAHDSDGHSVTIGYPHELSGAAVHAKAAVSLCLKMGWEGDLISGGTKDGYVFVFAESERFLNLTRDPRRASLPTPTAQGSKS